MPPSQYDINCNTCMSDDNRRGCKGHVEFSFLPLAEKKEIAIFLPGDNLDAQILN